VLVDLLMGARIVRHAPVLDLPARLESQESNRKGPGIGRALEMKIIERHDVAPVRRERGRGLSGTGARGYCSVLVGILSHPWTFGFHIDAVKTSERAVLFDFRKSRLLSACLSEAGISAKGREAIIGAQPLWLVGKWNDQPAQLIGAAARFVDAVPVDRRAKATNRERSS
jgi:hypothetical protein